MYRRFGLLYALFSLLVLAVLVTIFLVRLNTTREFNVQEAQTSFIRLQGRVREALSGSGGAGADAGSDPADVIRRYSETVPTVRAVVIYNPDQGLRYVWTADVDYLGFAGTNLSEVRGFPTYRYSEISEFKIGAPFMEVARSQLYMDAIYRVLNVTDAYLPLRDTLISLIGFAFVTVLVAIVMNMSRRAEHQAAPGGAQAPPGRSRATVPPPATAPRAERTVTQTDRSTASPRVPTPAAPQQSFGRQQSAAMESSGAVAGPETHDFVPVEPVMEEVDIEEIATDPGEPGTLFNPVTNLSYRDHLTKRLGLELERAAYNDQDLTCMLVQFDDATGSQEATVERARQVLGAFKFEDLCFEYGRGSFCVILPNAELSRGIREAEAFKSDHAGRMYFGLSARNGRLVEASRVLGEAERSLEHAKKEPGGIVGFRPDPRKYRQFVTRHLGPQD